MTQPGVQGVYPLLVCSLGKAPLRSNTHGIAFFCGSGPRFECVLHHANMNVCEPVMDRWLIDDTFACRTGKGREAAIERAQYFTRSAIWFLKLDVRKYFDSVPHAKLMGFLERRFKDRRLLDLLNRIIVAYRGDLGIGLPIGSLTSQHFATFYLGWLDRFAKEALQVRGYGLPNTHAPFRGNSTCKLQAPTLGVRRSGLSSVLVLERLFSVPSVLLTVRILYTVHEFSNPCAHAMFRYAAAISFSTPAARAARIAAICSRPRVVT